MNHSQDNQFQAVTEAGKPYAGDRVGGMMGGLLQRLIEALFYDRTGLFITWVRRIWLAFLYVLGLVHWAYFLNWGKVPFDLHDWTQTGAYYSFLQQAVRHLQLPLHISSPLIPTDRYIARPDTLLSPQALLLWFLDPGSFMLANVLVLFTLGFIGLLLIRRRYQLAPVAFTAIFLLFSFNGHITAHLAVGHSEWVGYFLLPFFVYQVLALVEQRRFTWKWVLFTSLVLFFIFLQGLFHFFLWCLIFLFVLALVSRSFTRPALTAILFSVLLSLVRILPPTIEYFGGGPAFISGFITVADLFAALAVLQYPAEALSGPYKSLGGWEVDSYLGLIGLAFLLYFGVYRTWQKRSSYLTVFAPLSVLAFFSIGKIYAIVAALPIPLLDSERVPSRFLILPVTFLAILAGVQLQSFLNERERVYLASGLTGLALLVLMGHDLFQHSRIWRVTNMYQLFPRTPVDIRAAVANHPDPPYVLASSIGLLGSIITLIFLLWKARSEGIKREEIT